MSDDLFIAEQIDEHRQICISQLSPRTLSQSRVDTLGGTRGYFVYEVDDRPTGGGIAVLAKLASLDAAFRLLEIWRTRPGAA